MRIDRKELNELKILQLDLSFEKRWGNILAVFSGLGFAGLTLFMRKEKKDTSYNSIRIAESPRCPPDHSA